MGSEVFSKTIFIFPGCSLKVRSNDLLRQPGFMANTVRQTMTITNNDVISIKYMQKWNLYGYQTELYLYFDVISGCYSYVPGLKSNLG